MGISTRRLLAAVLLAVGMAVGGALPALAQTDNGLLGDGLGEESRNGQEPVLDPVTDPVNEGVCELTNGELALLEECGAVEEIVDEQDDGGTDDAGYEDDKHDDGGDDHAGYDDGHEDEDGAVTPTGGIETGAGGTAGDGAGMIVPLSLLGGTALTGGAAMLVRRRILGQAG